MIFENITGKAAIIHLDDFIDEVSGNIDWNSSKEGLRFWAGLLCDLEAARDNAHFKLEEEQTP